MSQSDNEQLNNEEVDALDTAEQQEAVIVEEQQNSDVRQKRKIAKFWDILLWVLIGALAVAVLVRAFVYTNVTIDGASMEPTYHSGDVVRVVKIGTPSRGDVVVFYKYEIDSKFKALFARGNDVKAGGKYEKLIKRVVAVEGDSIWVEPTEGGYKLVVKSSSGEIFRENYYTKDGETLSADTFILPDSTIGLGEQLSKHKGESNALVIEQGCFFAVGDNRGNSEDSRGELGQVPLNRLFGIVINR